MRQWEKKKEGGDCNGCHKNIQIKLSHKTFPCVELDAAIARII
jgi:hypothetical protein